MAVLTNKPPTNKAGDSYHTPDWLYKSLDTEFGFDCDPCPFDPEWSIDRVAEGLSIDGLALDWTNKRVFCNPPYSQIGRWVEKALRSQSLTVFLLPVRSDQAWFHALLDARAEVRYFRKRVHFVSADGKDTRMGEGNALFVIRRSLML